MADPPDAPLAPPRTGLSSLAPLRRRRYALVWSGGLVSNVGSWMQTVAVGALVVARTGEASWAVFVAAGAFLPIGVLSPIGGALADRWPRRRVLVAGNVAEAAVALTIAALVHSGRSGPALLVALVTVQGAVSAVVGPFQQAILPDLVPRSEFLAAAALNSAQFNIGRIVGPVLAGGAIAALGYPFAFVANAASFFAVVLAYFFVTLPPPPGAGSGVGIGASLRLGLGAARAEPGCRASILTIGVVAFLGSPFIALVPAMARRLSDGGARHLASVTAQLTTAQGLGAVIGALSIAPLARRVGRGRLLVLALGLLPFLLGAYALSPDLPAGTALLFCVGLVYIAVLSGLSTVVQIRAPAELRGRVISLYLVALGVAYPAGSLLQGPLADRFGLARVSLFAAVALAVVLGAGAVFRPELARELAAEPAAR